MDVKVGETVSVLVLPKHAEVSKTCNVYKCLVATAVKERFPEFEVMTTYSWVFLYEPFNPDDFRYTFKPSGETIQLIRAFDNDKPYTLPQAIILTRVK